MSWTAPMTAIANSALTAAQWNTHLRDNLLETGPAKAETAHGLIMTGATAGSLDLAERWITHVEAPETGSTTSTAYTDLPLSDGPTLSINTSGSFVVFLSATISISVSGVSAYMSFDATNFQSSFTPNDVRSIEFMSYIASNSTAAKGDEAHIGTAVRCQGDATSVGTKTIKAKYRVSSSSATAVFKNRAMVVIPV
jgi:hypothetical protein